MYRRFGAEVTVIEKGPHLVGREDQEISEAIRGILEAEGVRVLTGADHVSFSKHKQGVAVSVNSAELIGSDMLIAVGRRPNTDNLGLDRAELRPTRAATSRSMTICRPMSKASGRWATATARAPSPTPPTTTSRSSRRTCSMARIAGSPTASPGYALYIDPPLGRVG